MELVEIEILHLLATRSVSKAVLLLQTGSAVMVVVGRAVAADFNDRGQDHSCACSKQFSLLLRLVLNKFPY